MNPGSTGLTAASPQANDFPSLSFNILICKMGEMNPSFLEVIVKIVKAPMKHIIGGSAEMNAFLKKGKKVVTQMSSLIHCSSREKLERRLETFQRAALTRGGRGERCLFE